MNRPIRIELFGHLSARVGDRIITRFRTQRNASLLAYLAYFAGRRHPREILIEMLWPEGDPAAGRVSLRTALSMLMRQLEPPGTAQGIVLQADRFAVGLNAAAVSTDVADFLAAVNAARVATAAADRRKALARSLEFNSSELLPGYYEDWAVVEQRRLAEIHERITEEYDRLAGTDGDIVVPVLPVQSQTASATDLPRLPLRLTRFFGRQTEIEWLENRIRSGARLVTVTGVAGCGKTRLAVEVAERLVPHFEGRVWFVSLAPISDGRFIGEAILDTLGVTPSPSMDSLEQAAARIGAAPSLLVLDNLEHIVEAGAAAIRVLLERATGLQTMATSRRTLDLSGEREFPLSPLPLPDSNVEVESLSPQPSVSLFIDRAQAVRPDFQLTPRNAETIVSICRRLEGIPLALELAAARTQVLAPGQILSGLNKRFDFLVSRKRDIGDRHRSLAAAIEWSFQLLSKDLQEFFCRLTVFRGGWTLEAAREVCQEPDAFGLLEQLHEASMVIVEETSHGSRFRFLETMREFGTECLDTCSRQDLQQRHTLYFLSFAEIAETGLGGHEQMTWLAMLRAEDGNLCAALEWCLTVPEGLEPGLQMAAALLEYWLTGDRLTVGSDYLLRLLAKDLINVSPRVRIKVFLAAGRLQRFLCHYTEERDYTEARRLIEQGRQEAERLDDKKLVASAVHLIGVLLFDEGDPADALRHLEASLALSREMEDEPGIAETVAIMGLIELNLGHFDRCRPWFEEALAIGRKYGDLRLVCREQRLLAVVETCFGQSSRARELLHEAKQIALQLGDTYMLADIQKRYSVLAIDNDADEALRLKLESMQLFRQIVSDYQDPHDIADLAYIQIVRGRADLAARALGYLDTRYGGVEGYIPPYSRPGHLGRVEAARSALGEEAYQAAWQNGAALTHAQALACVSEADGI